MYVCVCVCVCVPLSSSVDTSSFCPLKQAHCIVTQKFKNAVMCGEENQIR